MRNSIFKFVSLTIALIAIGFTSMAQNVITKQDLSIFPKPEAGFKKVIIEVPHSDKDDSKRIEFSVGKWMDVDACNHFNLSGKFTMKDLQGWGYNYYVFETNGQVSSTLMGCNDKTKRKLFVTAQPEMVRYNGKLPIVIYVPEGYDVQYRIYKAEDETYMGLEEKSKK